MRQEIYIENLKCGGCVETIKKDISSINGVVNLEINLEKSVITFNADKNSKDVIKRRLSKLGYPEVGDKNTMLHKVKSFVSCASGKMNKL